MRGILQTCACWAAAASLVSVEVYIHCSAPHGGWDRSRYEKEGILAGLSWWSTYLAVCEGVCRSGLSVALVNLFWDTCSASEQNRLGPFLRETFFSDHLRATSAIKLVFASFTLIVGMWSVLLDNDSNVPQWIAAYSHVFDVFCHAIVTAALVGLLISVLGALRQCKLRPFVLAFLLCNTDIEDHGLRRSRTSSTDINPLVEALEETAVPQAPSAGEPGNMRKLCLLWLTFIVVLTGFVIGHIKALPWPLDTAISVLGGLCWVGIAWSLTEAANDTASALTCPCLELGQCCQCLSNFAAMPLYDQALAEAAGIEDGIRCAHSVEPEVACFLAQRSQAHVHGEENAESNRQTEICCSCDQQHSAHARDALPTPPVPSDLHMETKRMSL